VGCGASGAEVRLAHGLGSGGATSGAGPADRGRLALGRGSPPGLLGVLVLTGVGAPLAGGSVVAFPGAPWLQVVGLGSLKTALPA
jgi:hypothetical protein